MPIPGTLDSKEMTAKFFAMLQSLDQFNEREIRRVIDALPSPTDREQCFIALYRRSIGNVKTLLEMKFPKDVQAIAMLARALFELAVDIRLIDVVPNGWQKMAAFVDVEMLRCARKILDFQTTHPLITTDTSVQDSFVTTNAARIESLKNSLWPSTSKVKHWSDLSMPGRVAKLEDQFAEIYHFHYPQLSWYAHSGLTGVVNLKTETFVLVCGLSFRLAADSYWETLLAVIHEFRLSQADEKVHGKMKAAKLMPFTDSPEQAELLLRELTSG